MKPGRKFSKIEREKILNKIIELYVKCYTDLQIARELQRDLSITKTQAYLYIKKAIQSIQREDIDKETQRKRLIKTCETSIKETFENGNIRERARFIDLLLKLYNFTEVPNDNKLNIQVEIKDYNETTESNEKEKL